MFRRLCTIGILLSTSSHFVAAGSSRAEQELVHLAVQNSPRPAYRNGLESWRAAESHARQFTGYLTFCGQGVSMEPLYNPGTSLVVAPIEYNTLQPGMTVVFRSANRGHHVAHVLVEHRKNGWLTRGLNNATDDDELLRPRNLIGVVVAAYTPWEAIRRSAVAGN